MADIELVIKIPEGVMEYIKNNDCLAVSYIDEVAKAIKNGTPLPEHYGRLIDADKTLTIAWHKFWKQEEEHEKTIEGYDILRDRFYEQEGFECCQQTIVNAETIIPATKEKSCEDCTNWNEHYGTITCMDCQNRSLWKSNQTATKEGDGE